MKNSIKREQSQACLNFAERKNFRLQAKHKILMTLVALFAMTAGAWAADTYTITFSGFGNEACNKTVTDATLEYSETFNVTDVYANYSNLGGVGGSNEYVSISKSGDEKQITITVKSPFEGTVNVTVYYQNENWDETQSDISVTCVKSAPAGPEVTWNAATKTASFEMPAYDVEIAPIYAPTAMFATDGNLVLTPTAKEGVFAGTEDAIVKAGTVATGQGKAMYFATTDAKMTAEKAATADGWLSILPTAAGYDGATTVYVWYYIKGADTPDGQEATDKNTFNDSEICATPLTVTVLSNKFDITFKAANANTIEAGKATVTVGGTAATVTEGKLEGVKMGSEVKMTAKQGYKFRKVEAKKTVPAAVTTAPTAKTGVKAGQNEAIVNAGTAEGGTMMYAVTTDNTQPASTDGFSATVPTAEGLTAGTYYVWYYVKADDSHTDSEISATGIAVTIAAPAKPEYADKAEPLPANTKLYMRTDLVYNGDWTWSPTYTAEQAQAVANYYAAITGTKCAVIYGHGSGTDIYYVTSDNGVSGTVYRNNNLTDKFPGYKVYLLK